MNAFAVSQFHNHFALKTEQEQRQKFSNATERVKEVQTIYRPYRKYKRKDAGPEDEQTRVRITLLEYGNKGKDILPHHLKADIKVKTVSSSAAKAAQEENAMETQRNDSVCARKTSITEKLLISLNLNFIEMFVMDFIAD